jgi:predicted nucleotidyltransferase
LIIPKKGFIIPDMGTKKRARKPAVPRHTSVADALFTKGQQRVFAVLFGDPGRSFYANEIIARAGVGTGAVQRELGRLEAARLVTVTRVGNQKHYQANAAAPVFEELRGLVLKTSGLADVLRAALAPLATEVRAAFVFGSIAKNEDTARSDIDLMVVSDSLAHADLYETLADAAVRLGRRVNPTVYRPDEFSRRLQEQNSFLITVLAEPKIWLYGGEDELAA